MIKNIKVYNESATGDYLVTLAIGAEYIDRWERLSLPFWMIYCKRHEIGLIALIKPYTDKGNKRLDWQKMLVGKALSDNKVNAKGVCFVDYDLIPNPYSENIFNYKNQETIGFVSQKKNLPYGNVDLLINRIVYYRHHSSSGRYPLDSYVSTSPAKVFEDHGLTSKYDYGCGGLFLFNQIKHSEFFEEIFRKYSSDSKLIANAGEEVYLNWHIQNRSDFEWLGYEWHTLWWYEMAAYYPWLYFKEKREKSSIPDIILSSLSRTSFIHFVGSWEKWAWNYVDKLQVKEVLDVLEGIKEMKHKSFQSPSLGQIFPDSNEELELISR